ncbi:unnamed protein product [Sphagnum balticum]
MIRQIVSITALHTAYSSLTNYALIGEWSSTLPVSPAATASCAKTYVNVTLSAYSVIYDRSFMDQQLSLVIQVGQCSYITYHKYDCRAPTATTSCSRWCASFSRSLRTCSLCSDRCAHSR